jgi:excisionase family DNA binding protein
MSDSPYLTAKEAAAYLRISYSTFRKCATKIRRMPSTNRYRREDLDEFAASNRPKRKR